MVKILENETFDEIMVGESASMTRALRPHNVAMLAAVTGTST